MRQENSSNIKKTKVEDNSIKLEETQTILTPHSPETNVSTSPLTHQAKQEESSHASPSQEDQELIDITSIKAEDVPIQTIATKVEEIETSPSELDDKAQRSSSSSSSSLINSNNDTNTDIKIETENQRPASAIEENNLQASSSSSSINMDSTTNFEEIQNQLKKTLDHIEQRNMVSGFRTLSNATSAVVDHCEQLGLTSDDHPYNAIDREQFWAGLNNCWLYALAQRHEPSSDDEKMTVEQLCQLRERVVAWADKLERFGLVDYEMGWWEADILAAMDTILATNYASAQAAAQAAMAKAAAAIFGNEAC